MNTWTSELVRLTTQSCLGCGPLEEVCAKHIGKVIWYIWDGRIYKDTILAVRVTIKEQDISFIFELKGKTLLTNVCKDNCHYTLDSALAALRKGLE